MCKSLKLGLSGNVSEIFNIKEWHDLETGVGVVQGFIENGAVQ